MKSKFKFLPQTFSFEGRTFDVTPTFNVNNAMVCYRYIKSITTLISTQRDALLKIDILRSNSPDQEEFLFALKLVLKEMGELVSKMELDTNLLYDNSLN